MNPNPQVLASKPHPLAGEQLSGAEMLVQVLADEGVETIFGYSGGAILPTYDAVFRFNDEHRDADGNPPMPLIVPANENEMLAHRDWLRRLGIETLEGES